MDKISNPNSPIALFVKAARSSMKMTQDEFAIAYHCTKGNVSGWENGRHEPTYDVLRDMSEKSGVPLPGDESKQYSLSNSQNNQLGMLNESHAPYNASSTDGKLLKQRAVKEVNVIGNGSGNPLPEHIWDDAGIPVGYSDKFAEIATTDEHAFIIRVVGDSMSPRYEHGEYALVEPETPPEIEDDVLVRLNTGETLLKRLASKRDGIRLRSLNNPDVLHFQNEEVIWIYYVAHPVPARRIKSRTA